MVTSVGMAGGESSRRRLITGAGRDGRARAARSPWPSFLSLCPIGGPAAAFLTTPNPAAALEPSLRPAEPHNRDRRCAMAVARVTTIIGSSPKGWQDAVGEALKRANKTLRNLTGIRVLEQTARIEKGKVTEFRSMIEVSFILED